MSKMYLFVTFILFAKYNFVHGICEKPNRMLAAEDICWASKVKIATRIQYTTKSVLNFAKEKLGLETDSQNEPLQCDYYECIFKELKMVNENGFPDHNKIVAWIDSNIIYKFAKTQYEVLEKCIKDLKQTTNSYFSGDPNPLEKIDPSHNKCEILKEFMKCLSENGTECVIFQYP